MRRKTNMAWCAGCGVEIDSDEDELMCDACTETTRQNSAKYRGDKGDHWDSVTARLKMPPGMRLADYERETRE